MNNVITVNMLLQFCKDQVQSGNGDKKILLSDDDEGNGFHCMFYAFTGVDEAIGNYDYLLPFGVDEKNKNNFIILG